MSSAPPRSACRLTSPSFHSGQVRKLEDAVAIMGSSQLGATLTPDEIEAITEFLHTLTGKIPTIQVPAVPVETPETPHPEP